MFFWMASVVLAMAALIAIVYILVRVELFGPVPSSKTLKSIENYNASEILASGGEQLGKYFLYDRTSVSLEEVSLHVTDALLSTEDVRFYKHRGVDIRSLGRVVVKNIIMRRRSAGGGSTITLQLAKNLYPRSGGNRLWVVTDKLREIIIAKRLERVYTKDEILMLYLNTVPFGDNVFGISAASHRFFNKSPIHLHREESALLVGMLKATHTYNPRIYPEQSLLRRNTVIDQMSKYDVISKQHADSLKALPLILDYKPISHIHGPAPYFREHLRKDLTSWLEEYNARNETAYNLYTDGLIIHTSIDYELQLLAEEAMKNRLQLLQEEVERHYGRASRVRATHLLDQLMKRSERYAAFRKQGLSETEAKQAFMEDRESVLCPTHKEI